MFKEYKLLIKGTMINNIICFAVILFLLFVVGGFLINDMMLDSRVDSEVQAHNIKENCKKNKKGVKECTPSYYYMVDGKEYICGNLGTYEQKDLLNINMVYYDSKNPSVCKTDLEAISFPVMVVILSIVVVIFLITLTLMIKSIRHYKKFKKIISQKFKLHRSVICSVKAKRKYLFGLGAYYYEADINTKNGIKHCISNRYMTLDDEIKRVDILISEENPDLYIVDFCIF